MAGAVHVQNVLGQARVQVTVVFVQNQKEQVETRQQGRRQIDVFAGTLVLVVATVGRIRSRQNGRARIQRRINTSLE